MEYETSNKEEWMAKNSQDLRKAARAGESRRSLTRAAR